MRIWLALALLALLPGGCAGLIPDQRARLEDWQGFAGRVTARYGAIDVTFLVGVRPGASGGAVRSGDISDGCPSWPEPRWTKTRARLDAMSKAEGQP
jgi:hypothetical protein